MRQKTLQSVWSPKTLIGFRLPSGKTVRPPQIPASGVRPAKPASRSIAPSSTKVSGLSSKR